MRNAKLRNHYLRIQKYLGKFPNDLVARESFNSFLMSLQSTSKENYMEVTNITTSQEELDYLSPLFETKVPKIKKRSRNSDDFEDMWENDMDESV